MKKKIKVSVLLLVLTLLFIECESNRIDIVDIPDENFLAALIEEGVDSNGDGQISVAEAEAISKIDVSGTYSKGGYISNLTGIEAFLNLGTLFCATNLLTSLDLSNNTALTSLNCGNRKKVNLDITN